MKSKYKSQKGYTIVELMVANVIFSLILLAAMAALVQIGRLYYKGITASRTQETARAVIEELSQAIQFSNSEIDLSGINLDDSAGNHSGFICVGPVRYTFLINNSPARDQVVDSDSGPIYHSLWRDIPAGGCANSSLARGANLSAVDPCDSPTAPYVSCSEGRELLEDNMSLTNFIVSNPPTGLSIIDLAIAYGEGDLLEEDPNIAGRTVCKGATIGVEFCAISELSTTVTRRVQ